MTIVGREGGDRLASRPDAIAGSPAVTCFISVIMLHRLTDGWGCAKAHSFMGKRKDVQFIFTPSATIAIKSEIKE